MTSKAKAAPKRVLPPTYFLGAVALTILLHMAFPLRQLVQFPWRLLGLLPLAAGGVLNVLADQAFKRYQTTVKPFERSSTLVSSGVFLLSRNPMYLGIVLTVLGVAVLLGSATPFAVVASLAVLLDRMFIVPEERMLEDTFGESYRRYRERVRRWI